MTIQKALYSKRRQRQTLCQEKMKEEDSSALKVVCCNNSRIRGIYKKSKEILITAASNSNSKRNKNRQ